MNNTSVAVFLAYAAISRPDASRVNWTPSSRLIDSTRSLEALYKIWDVAAAITATKDAVLMLEPLPCACMNGRADLQQ